ncbi:PadR family transcriptional regulator [Arthrobacter globiformis]|uniref:PadR family transcriptional regulator n=1 Tax=Arthrobacter globiformis TaxID=1665 RepID=UPI00397B2673
MKFEEILLALIARAPCSGYDLGRWLGTEGQFVRANADQSQIYKTLSRLLKHDHIEFTVEEREGAPDAKVYRLTDTGVEHLTRVTESQYVPPARWQEPDFTARLTCLVPLNPPTVLPLIETELAFRKDQIKRYRNRDRGVLLEQSRFPIDVEFMAELLNGAHNYNAAQADSWVAWLEAQHRKWTAYLGAGIERSATLNTTSR